MIDLQEHQTRSPILERGVEVRKRLLLVAEPGMGAREVERRYVRMRGGIFREAVELQLRPCFFSLTVTFRTACLCEHFQE